MTMPSCNISSIKSYNFLIFAIFVNVVLSVRSQENHLENDRLPRQLSSIFSNLFGHGHGHSNTRESEGRYGLEEALNEWNLFIKGS